MPAEIIQVQYETLTDIANRFGSHSELTSEYTTRMRRRMVALQNGGWQGRGAQAFFVEMENETLPAAGRLSTALAEAQTITLQIIEILHDAEEEAARPFGKSGDRLDGVSSGTDQSLVGEHSIWDLPTVGKDVLAIWDIASDNFEKIPGLGLFGPLFGTIFEAWDNPDSDWLKSIVSSATQEFGIYGIGIIQPEAAVAKGGSDVIQVLGRVGHAVDGWEIGRIITDPEIKAGMLVEMDQYYDNIERVDLDHAIEPLADIIYDYSIAPYIHIVEDTWHQPSLENIAELSLLPVLGIGGMGAFYVATDSGTRQDIRKDAKDLGAGLWKIGTGLVTLPIAMTEYKSVKVVGETTNSVDSWPISATWKESIESAAETYIHGMNTL
jgi:WXG100 family type VII secretion target